MVHHFADDTNLLSYNNSAKRMNKKVNQDLKILTNWLNLNKVCLNVSKTEVALFKSSRKFTDVRLKLKLNGKWLSSTNSVKYLGINIDEYLNWKQQISNIAIKLNKANGILYKLRHFVDRKTLKSVYHAIFEPVYIIPHLLGTKFKFNYLIVLQKKSLRIIYFLNHSTHTSTIFRELNILKVPDKIDPENFLFINKYFNKWIPTIFKKVAYSLIWFSYLQCSFVQFRLHYCTFP